ncbi:DnaJ domain-containing protein [Acidovorax sp. ACV02]|uniref:J domain-containing protein n=1 Tax=Acidovorax sp. ACV02 TaxID=2769310 RepID=UPI0017869C09|nr:DnaJ domain-containing protein [Acidovorax sp. ACV02]MBD9406234.1 DnaJ domain-containing protein [Acidovorax sp. ACV02]
MSRPDHYATLGVAPDASLDDIKRAYRRAARHAHPDRGGNHERMQALNQAKEVLTDPARRARYDAGEDGQATTEEEGARELIRKLFAEAVDIDKDDPVEGVREALQAGRAGAAVKATTLRQSIRRLEAQRDRVKAKTERNVYLEVIESRIASARENIKAMETTERMATMALEILAAEYERGPGVEPARPRSDMVDAIRYGLLPEKPTWRSY